MPHVFRFYPYLFTLLALLPGVVLGGLLLYSYHQLEETNAALAEVSAAHTKTSTELQAANAQITNLRDTLTEVRDTLEAEESQNDRFRAQIDAITDTVDELDKLSKTDEELLQKYSKVYFLNEHYVPADLSEIDESYVADTSRLYFLHSDVIPYLNDLMEDARDDGIELQVASAYRSFARQSQLKGEYRVTYGEGANAFSADQGYSEHQLGTAVDFTTPALNGGLRGFGDTDAYQWLMENAHKYGFVLSYPEDNEYYIFEPWHWRFVGEALAKDLHEADAHFYDWEQRRLDEYLLEIFD